jgi:hypothetical protein
MTKVLAQSLDDGALMEACYETASRTMFDSEPESLKIKEVADQLAALGVDGFFPMEQVRIFFPQLLGLESISFRAASSNEA